MENLVQSQLFASLSFVIAVITTVPSLQNMGLPYSKQINAAFDQVTPLVAAGFEVLETTKNISLLLAWIQVLTVVLLAFIVLELFALLVTINPDLQTERQAIVTPAVKWISALLMRVAENRRSVFVVLLIVAAGLAIGSMAGLYYTSRDPTLRIDESLTGDDVLQLKGEDIEAIKKGQTDQ